MVQKILGKRDISKKRKTRRNTCGCRDACISKKERLNEGPRLFSESMKTKTKQNKANVTPEKDDIISANQTPGGYKFAPLVASQQWRANQLGPACFVRRRSVIYTVNRHRSIPEFISGRVITCRWRSLPRVQRHRASSSPQVSSSNKGCYFSGITMDQLLCAPQSLYTPPPINGIIVNMRGTQSIRDGKTRLIYSSNILLILLVRMLMKVLTMHTYYYY